MGLRPSLYWARRFCGAKQLSGGRSHRDQRCSHEDHGWWQPSQGNKDVRLNFGDATVALAET